MIAHKCTRLCDPDEGVHCIPETWDKGRTVEEFNSWYHQSDMDVLKVQPESDVTPETMTRAGVAYNGCEHCDTGYLIWVKDR